jgi:hypothetical protein
MLRRHMIKVLNEFINLLEVEWCLHFRKRRLLADESACSILRCDQK